MKNNEYAWREHKDDAKLIELLERTNNDVQPCDKCGNRVASWHLKNLMNVCADCKKLYDAAKQM